LDYWLLRTSDARNADRIAPSQPSLPEWQAKTGLSREHELFERLLPRPTRQAGHGLHKMVRLMQHAVQNKKACIAAGL
jgi:hypothetical protein